MAAEDLTLSTPLRNAVMRLARRLRAERADSGLGLTKLAALSTLDRLGPMSPSELAAHEKVQPPSMTRILATLAEYGLVERDEHPTDRRQAVVSVTDAGRRMLAADRRRRDAWLSKRLRDLDDDERAVLARAAAILDRLASS